MVCVLTSDPRPSPPSLQECHRRSADPSLGLLLHPWQSGPVTCHRQPHRLPLHSHEDTKSSAAIKLPQHLQETDRSHLRASSGRLPGRTARHAQVGSHGEAPAPPRLALVLVEQEVGDALHHAELAAGLGAHQRALLQVHLQQHVVQLPEKLLVLKHLLRHALREPDLPQRLGGLLQRLPLQPRPNVTQKLRVELRLALLHLLCLYLERVPVLDALDVARQHVVRYQLHRRASPRSRRALVGSRGTGAPPTRLSAGCRSLQPRSDCRNGR
mmetsp:Transcript_22194/g.56890  ORF Transcript_22194/g.56890 Transcript_22194/m.56890 type:complete len:270 (+) Transcript_22194:3-812(+)